MRGSRRGNLLLSSPPAHSHEWNNVAEATRLGASKCAIPSRLRGRGVEVGLPHCSLIALFIFISHVTFFLYYSQIIKNDTFDLKIL